MTNSCSKHWHMHGFEITNLQIIKLDELTKEEINEEEKPKANIEWI